MTDELYKGVMDAAERQRGADHCDELRDMLNAISEIPREQALSLRMKIAGSMAEVESPTGAGMLAIWMGASVEHGMDPGPTIEPILKTMLRWTGTMVTIDDDEVDDPEPDSETLIGTELLGQSLVAHLSRSSEWIDEVKKQPEVAKELERVEHLTVGATWVLELLNKCSGDLIVLHAEKLLGVRVRYENLSNCFHLFSLLQGALADVMPDTQELSGEVIAAARGESDDYDLSDSAWWHYGNGNVPKADFAGTVFGESNPAEIPEIDGQQVLLLWPPILKGRSWDSGFFGPVLSSALPELTIKEDLTPEAVKQWHQKLGLNGAQPGIA